MAEFRYAKAGDRVIRSASTINAMIDAARSNSRTHNPRFPQEKIARDSSVIYVRNDTASNLDRFAVVGLADPIFSPVNTLDSERFLIEEPHFGIEWPTTDTHRGRFGVLLQPLEPQGIGVARLCDTQLAFIKTNVMRGDAVDIDEALRPHNNTLCKVDGGCATVLWEGGVPVGSQVPTGSKWGLIRFGGGGGGGTASLPMVEFALIEVCCDTLTARARVTGIICGGSSVAVGDEICLIDSTECHFVGANPEPSMWTEIRGWAVLREFNLDDYYPGDYDEPECEDFCPITQDGECHWAVVTLCCNGNFCE